MFTVPPVMTFEPTSHSPGSSPQQPTLPLGTGTIVAGPDRVWDLARPVTLDGVLTYRDPSNGQVSIQTAMGLLTVAIDTPLQPGATLTARIIPGDPPEIALFAQSNAGHAPSLALPEAPAVVLNDPIQAGPLEPGQIVILTPVAGTPQPILSSATVPLQNSVPTAAPVAPTQGDTAEPAPDLIAAPGPGPDPLQPLAGQPPIPRPPAAPGIVARPGSTSPTLSPISTTPAADIGQVSVADSAQASATIVSNATASVDRPPSTDPTATNPAAPTLVLASLPLTGLPSALAAQFPEADATAETFSSVNSVTSNIVAAPADQQNEAFAARIVAIVPPGSPAALSTAGAISATVEGITLAGQPIIETDAGSFVLQSPATVAPGTQLVFERVDAAPTPRAGAPAPFDPVGGKGWPALAAALPAIAASQPALADAIRMTIPQAGPLMAPLLLLFVASLRGGDVRNWLSGKALDALRTAGRSDIASTLAADFSGVARQASAPMADGWHAIPVPMLVDGELDRMQLHLRRYPAQSQEGGKDGHDSGVRFLIDVEPSAFGPVQLDGLVRRAETPRGAAALELILRSQTPLSKEIRGDIGRLFADSLATNGLKGAIAFQGGANWVKVARDRQAARNVIA